MQHPLDQDLTADVNAHVLELAEAIDPAHRGKHRWGFMCECGAADCLERVLLSLGQYEGLRFWGRPVLAPGHARQNSPLFPERRSGQASLMPEHVMEQPGNPRRTHTRAKPANELFASDEPLTRDVTKEELYQEARRLGIKGRSRMNKGQLASAVARRRQS